VTKQIKKHYVACEGRKRRVDGTMKGKRIETESDTPEGWKKKFPFLLTTSRKGASLKARLRRSLNTRKGGKNVKKSGSRIEEKVRSFSTVLLSART